MILAFAARGKKTVACIMLALMYTEMVVPAFAMDTARNGNYHFNRPVSPKPYLPALPAKKRALLPTEKTVHPPLEENEGDIGGPTQPESEAFHSANADNMVDLFTGNFSYTIPLLDVGGYPLAIGYSSGIDMDQQASWVGLGWNINPGTITRNVRGIPDDFNGTDSILKTTWVKENKTIGVSGGADIEIVGAPVNFGGSHSIFHNSYRGWGLEKNVNASINVANSSAGSLGAGLAITNNSQEGLTLSPSLSYSLSTKKARDEGGMGGSLSVGLPYNSRSGMKALQYSAGITWYKRNEKQLAQTAQAIAALQEKNEGVPSWIGQTGANSVFSSGISFAYPSFTPAISIPYTSVMTSITVKMGWETKVVHPNLFISGYVSKQGIADEDTTMIMPAFGYLNFQNGRRNTGALLDYNREKEIPYRETPAVPTIALPGYTYDVFTMSGEGTGGTFRAYRSDIGYVHDHSMRTRDASSSYGVNMGFGDIVHAGADVSFTRAYTQNGPWVQANPLASIVAFTDHDKDYEAVYFRNPGEKTVNTNEFYDAIGGDDVVRAKLFQNGRNSPNISTTGYLTRYRSGKAIGDIQLSRANAVKKTRDKRTQTISYLNAEETANAGFSRYIENYSLNRIAVQDCNTGPQDELSQDGTGFKGEYFYRTDRNNRVKAYEKNDPLIAFMDNASIVANPPPGVSPLGNQYSVRWTGRIKAPVTGVYNITTDSDDGVVLCVNDTCIIDDWKDHPPKINYATLNLEAGEVYNIKLDYFNGVEGAKMVMEWKCGDVTVGTKDMYWPDTTDSFEAVPGVLTREERVNSFRKANHISQIDVLNNDGKRYIYGLPAYNLKQKEVTFSVKNSNGNAQEGTVSYDHGADNSTRNINGNDHYYTGEETPPYAHAYLLTALVSPDYVDLTGNGISDDDPGNAIRFNYTKTAGLANPYRWRTPYAQASYNEGLKTDTRDDKGSYLYGEKELWYLNSIESKNMIAVFTLEDRSDMASINENGTIDANNNSAKRLKEINLYTKADFLKRNTAARPVKTVHFEYNYELCKGVNPAKPDTGKLTLKRIWFSYNGNKKGSKNAYVFNYNSKNPDYNPRSSDRWGTYKNPLDNPGSSSNDLITNAEFPYALQDSAMAAQNAPAWALDSIVLPSGGRMKVTYESDDYAYVQNRRAAQMFRIAGFSADVPSGAGSLSNRLYGSKDHLYVGIHVPYPVTSREEVYHMYLENMDTLYFRMHVKMPDDKWGKGYEFVSGYARADKSDYGFINGGNTIWLKLGAIDRRGLEGGTLSPLAKTAIEFLRLNLPSKAYPGSDVGDNLDMADGVKVLFSLADNITNLLRSYDATARSNGWARETDLARSYIRLNNPVFKKYGGGHRVKRIVIYDHWNAMTGKKESMYGSEYTYTTVKNIHGEDKVISSGVAIYEPMLGGEENPFRQPIEYNEQVAPLAPTNLGYVEKPLGESLFPAPAVGYSCVRKRAIKTKHTRSANGYEETTFYTAYDFPIIVEHSLLDPESKLKYKPILGDVFRVAAAYHIALSQGFKIELNDMHGKVRTHAIYAESNPVDPISYTENFYHVDDIHTPFKHLNNRMLTMHPDGRIDTASTIGKDIELMMDMREQQFLSNGTIINANADVFSFGLPPVLGAFSFLTYPQRQDNLYRSVAATKVINRQGILDSVVVVEKGSRVVTHNMLFDAETGDVLLTATQNEHGDTLYQFSYPAGWVYDGMSGAYRNIGAVLDHIDIKEGKITAGLAPEEVNNLFSSGDEILVRSRNKVDGVDCEPVLASFRSYGKIWAVDANALSGGDPAIYFLDQSGVPFTGNDMEMKIVRSGRKNISASAGGVTMLRNPLRAVDGIYQLVINADSRIIDASMVEYKQNWQIEDSKKSKIICAY
ncbi:PA14 domain-containing protein [Chitinophaga sp. XS-30]|uniref:PA14 domain-containing protein n=1 Tax=Chitinophaga sp. XS-30 TaxID=2604421 RepID=UPI0011DE3B21|nr:PA14 domain-containing protein [Chitinophaga sp. XS-30]QEH43316.1 hypothetical protein FW415_21615 [Chitinophaga sp. XS-30]